MRALDHNTVFFLGAGFSKAAGAPTQAELLYQALNYTGDSYGNPIEDYQERLLSFLYDAFSLEEIQIGLFGLEDFYTPIDKCILENSSFRGYSLEYIKQLRYELSMLISIVIDNKLINSPEEDKMYIDHFIEFINVNRQRKRGRDITIITTNWDILIDRRIYERLGPGHYRRGIDYGTKAFYLSDGGVRVNTDYEPFKLYKIHGSLNWLKCPSCNRLFVNPAQKIGIRDQHVRRVCRNCTRVYRLPPSAENGLTLEPQIVYPTFLKDFSNIHFAEIWENAADEISEAERLIFIGYSFPQADFEIRQMLARKVPDNCEIICVLFGKEPSRRGKYYNQTEKARYENFFGRRRIRFFYSGASDFILNELENL